jgi:hypothetical protein
MERSNVVVKGRPNVGTKLKLKVFTTIYVKKKITYTEGSKFIIYGHGAMAQRYRLCSRI